MKTPPKACRPFLHFQTTRKEAKAVIQSVMTDPVDDARDLVLALQQDRLPPAL